MRPVRTVRAWLARFGGLFGRRRRDRELAAELESHVQMHVADNLRAGMTPEEARRQALLKLGGIEQVKENVRDFSPGVFLDALLNDVRYAVRSLWLNRAFATVAILTLGLGIGANTAIFSAVNAALLRPLPFSAPDRLVRLVSVQSGRSLGGPSPMDTRDLADAAREFEGMVVYDRWRKNVSFSGSSRPEQMIVGLVPGEYFSLLGLRPLRGRLFTDEEAEPGKHFVAAISQSLWRSRFDSDPQILGQAIRINSETYEIVAVMPDVIPPWMEQTGGAIRIWTPFSFPEYWTEAARGARGFGSLARLKTGVPYDQARAELAAISARLAREHAVDEGVTTAIVPLADTRSGPVRPVLLMLAAAVGLVLLISCANLAALLLARNSARYRELAVRLALGASRSRLLRQLLLETSVLSLAGGLLGVLLAWLVSVALSQHSAIAELPYANSFGSLSEFWSSSFDPRVLLFAFGISILTSALFGLWPALSGTRVSIAETLKEGGRGGTAGVTKATLRRALVIAEIALSLVLILAAGLLAQSVLRLQHQNLGFRPDHVLKARFYLPSARYPDSRSITQFCDQFSERLRSLPGVADASVTTAFPPSVPWTQMFSIEDRMPARLSDIPTTRWAVVDDRYLSVMGMSIDSGRDFAESDTAAGLPVALINREFARRYFPHENPLGRRIHMGPPQGLLDASSAGAASSTVVTVVGVFANFPNDGMGAPAAPQILGLFRQQPDVNFGFKDIVVRTKGDPADMASELSDAMGELDPEVPLAEVQTMTDYLGGSIANTRLTTFLLSAFAGLGTLLATIGAYGLISYLVAQRTQELGVRVALGADPFAVLWLILRQGLWMGLAGVSLGAGAAILLRQFLSRFLYGISETDPVTLASAAFILLLVVATASAIPAWRASRVDPMVALRQE
jgi:putative ABC transport system permease protein